MQQNERNHVQPIVGRELKNEVSLKKTDDQTHTKGTAHPEFVHLRPSFI